MTISVNKLRAKLRLTLLAKGREIEEVSVEEIPRKWEEFGSKEDKWISVNFPESENSSGCIYIGMEGSVFDPHIHNNSVEHFTVLNKGGEVEVITDQWVKTVKYPNSIVIDKGVPHAAIFKKETKILVIWHPKFEDGWSADFIKND
jgi:quercetin dioxygenase-like cupin family protein